jgi:hypothetical protein
MIHAQKPDFVFRRNGRVYLNRRGRQFSRLLAAEVCASAVVMLDTPRNVKSTGYQLHSPVSPSLPLPCVTVCHYVLSGVYRKLPPKNWKIIFSVIYVNVISFLKTVSYLPPMQLCAEEYKKITFREKKFFIIVHLSQIHSPVLQVRNVLR